MIEQDEAARSAGKGGERGTQRARETGPPRREEGCVPEEGGQRILERLQRGASGNWRGCGGRSAMVYSVCRVSSKGLGFDDLSQNVDHPVQQMRDHGAYHYTTPAQNSNPSPEKTVMRTVTSQGFEIC